MAITIIGRQWNADSEKLKTQVGRPIDGNGKRTEGDFLAKPAERSMQQKLDPGLNFYFAAPPASFTHEGYGAEFNEIKRPYNVPLVDVLGAKARRASFEFPLIQPVKSSVAQINYPGDIDPQGYDQFGNPRSGRDSIYRSRPQPAISSIVTYDNFWFDVEDQISRLTSMADMAIPIGFTNFHDALTSSYWYIDSITFTHSRANIQGKTVSASCNISLLEFIPSNKKFILLPRIAYKKYTVTGKKRKEDAKAAVSDPDYWLSDILAAEEKEAALARSRVTSNVTK
jgi:hypothetical protein